MNKTYQRQFDKIKKIKDMSEDEFAEKYTNSIPDECSLKTLKQHVDMLGLCWSVTSSFDEDIKPSCGKFCEFSKNYDEKEFLRLLERMKNE